MVEEETVVPRRRKSISLGGLWSGGERGNRSDWACIKTQRRFAFCFPLAVKIRMDKQVRQMIAMATVYQAEQDVSSVSAVVRLNSLACVTSSACCCYPWIRGTRSQSTRFQPQPTRASFSSAMAWQGRHQ